MSTAAILILCVAFIYALMTWINWKITNTVVETEIRIRKDIKMLAEGLKEDDHEYHKKFLSEE